MSEWTRTGWRIVLATTMGATFGYSNLAIVSVGFFVIPLSEAAGWARGDVAMTLTILSLCAVLSAPAAGMLADRFGTRKVAASSSILLAGSFLLAGWSVPALPAFYLAYFSIGLLGAGLMPPTLSRAIVQHFQCERGLALGVTLGGVGVGATLLPLVLGPTISTYGAVMGFYLLALLALAPLPFVLFIPPTAPTPTSTSTSTAVVPTFSVFRQRRSRALTSGKIIVAAVLLGLFTGATWSSMVVILDEKDIRSDTVALAMSGLAATLTVSRLITGLLLDRLGPTAVSTGMLFPAALGLLLLAIGPDGDVALMYVLLIGIGIGAEFDLLAFLVARHTPKERFGRAFGFVYSFFNIGAGFGPIVLHWSVERFDKYDPALLTLSVAILIAMTLVRALPVVGRPEEIDAEPAGRSPNG